MDLEKLLSGLALAAVTALTFVAYKHPAGYRRLLKPIHIVVPVLLVAALTWDTGSARGFHRIHRFIDPSKYDDALKTLHDGDWVSGYVLIAYIAGMLYLAFLSWLPNLLGIKEPPEEEHN